MTHIMGPSSEDPLRQRTMSEPGVGSGLETVNADDGVGPPLAIAAVTPSSTWRTLANLNTRSKLPKGLDAVWDAGAGWLSQRLPRRQRYLRRAERICRASDELTTLSDGRLRERAIELRERFRLGRETGRDVDESYALIREAGFRTLGLRAHREQVAAALAMYDGCLVELATGEGKTLAATLPATVSGWRGRGCHVITVNDYLAERDAEGLASLYGVLGLRVSSVVQEMSPEDRRHAYLADVTYLTNKEATADFLRDRLLLGDTANLPSALLSKLADEHHRGPEQLVQRGLDSAIVDEADSVLIDEAVTPLIISGATPNQEQVEAYEEAHVLAGSLSSPGDYKVNRQYREVDLTRAGRQKLAVLTAERGGVWSGARRREELVTQALTANHFYLRDEQYIVDDGKIVIVDESTGRLMPDREWRDGLHQSVSAKEGVEVEAPKATLARVSFQRFFRQYRKLAGMTGTGWEGRSEFWSVYKLPVVRIPTHRPCIRVQAPDQLWSNRDERWGAVVRAVSSHHEAGRPVLVGTRSIESSELLSRLLTEAGLEHQVLNAVHHAEEASIVARAGQPGRVTVATNMAGRGTDIKLGPGVAEAGGLAVIATERNDSSRIDRQLFGRAGRQGDPGSAEAIICLEDELLRRHGLGVLMRAVRSATRGGGRAPRWLASLLVWSAQRRAQGQAQRQRKGVLRRDDWLDEFLGFASREA